MVLMSQYLPLGVRHCSSLKTHTASPVAWITSALDSTFAANAWQEGREGLSRNNINHCIIDVAAKTIVSEYRTAVVAAPSAGVKPVRHWWPPFNQLVLLPGTGPAVERGLPPRGLPPRLRGRGGHRNGPPWERPQRHRSGGTPASPRSSRWHTGTRWPGGSQTRSCHSRQTTTMDLRREGKEGFKNHSSHNPLHSWRNATTDQ